MNALCIETGTKRGYEREGEAQVACRALRAAKWGVLLQARRGCARLLVTVPSVGVGNHEICVVQATDSRHGL